ncbi:PEP-CTERM sorting domain-containing protein [Pseudoduganella lutea]|uniref:PEP-CTERM sorting domain-containing protein n=2 Tax=Pseudoduganella lutea TaxID=321985 RepID=A0A4P6L8G0_9BURK|nr:PEP-CTERM sorting domain-containing protein [Pseudoduganella lutea]
MSYESVFAATQTGGIFSGFTLASTAQVRQLFNNVGANVWYSSGMGGYSDGCRDWTCHDWYSTLVAGITSDVAEFSGVHHIAGEQWGYTRAMGSYHFQMSGSQRDSEGDPMHGAFLFRDLSVSPVPEPATYGMLGAGLALVGMRLRRKRMY